MFDAEYDDDGGAVGDGVVEDWCVEIVLSLVVLLVVRGVYVGLV